MFVAADGRTVGLLGVSDPIEASTKEEIARVHQAGVRLVMRIADNRKTAEAVTKMIGTDDVQAEVLPETKSERQS